MITPPPSLNTTFTGSAHVNLWDFKGAGVDPTGVNDSTAGVQAAVNQAAAGGQAATIWVPGGTYLLAGPPKSTANANAQVLLPQPDGLSANWCTQLTIRGMQGCTRNLALVSGLVAPATNFLPIFKSTATSGAMFGSGAPSTAIITTPPTSSLPPVIGSQRFSLCGAIFEDLYFVTGVNPTASALNLCLAPWAQLTNIHIYDSITGPVTRNLPTNSLQFGVAMPYQFNYGGGVNKIDGVFVLGSYSGIILSEHTHVITAQCNSCRSGLVLRRSEHLMVVDHIVLQQCQYGIDVWDRDPFFTDNRNLTRARINCSYEQHITGPFGSGYSLNDPNNYGSGIINYSMNAASSMGGFSVNGGTNWTLTSFSPAGGNP